jgi:hypothetical protein
MYSKFDIPLIQQKAQDQRNHFVIFEGETAEKMIMITEDIKHLIINKEFEL